MTYPLTIRSALYELECRNCCEPMLDAHVFALEPHIVLDHTAQTGMRTLVKIRCPCGRQMTLRFQLDRDELDAAIRELRLRANRPESRRERDQAHVFGPHLRPRDHPRPSARGVPAGEITDDEVAAFEQRMSRTNFQVGEISTNMFLVDLFEAGAHRQPPDEDETPDGDG